MTGLRTLLVDDHSFVRKMLAQFMADLNVTMDEFGDPARALDAFTTAPATYDLVITDISMEGMTGFEFAERIRRVRPTMPIVLMSGDPYRKDGELIEPGMIFLSKPFTQDALAGAIEVVLGNYRERVRGSNVGTA